MFDKKVYMAKYRKDHPEKFGQHAETGEEEHVRAARNRIERIEGLKKHLEGGRKAASYVHYLQMTGREVQVALGDFPMPQEWILN